MTSPYDDVPARHNAVTEALRNQQDFDRAQVAWLMSLAMGWGYDLGYEDGQRDELALATVAAEYAHRQPFSAHETVTALKKRRYREACDAAARLPRPNDFRGREAPQTRAAA